VPSHPGRFLTLSNVGGPVEIEYEGGTERLERAESCVLPAAVGEVRVVPEGEAKLIVCYVPDLERDVAAPVREAGYSDEEIRTLGEVVT
jgi:mannose-6-phosphate isomerase